MCCVLLEVGPHLAVVHKGAVRLGEGEVREGHELLGQVGVEIPVQTCRRCLTVFKMLQCISTMDAIPQTANRHIDCTLCPEHCQTSHTMCAPVDGPGLARGPDAAQRRGPLQHRDGAELRAVAGRPQTRGASADDGDVHHNNERARDQQLS